MNKKVLTIYTQAGEIRKKKQIKSMPSSPLPANWNQPRPSVCSDCYFFSNKTLKDRD
jgi:hypothetical protein